MVMSVRSYAIVTGAYWSFMVTDGALRMLVLLYFHDLGYRATSLALLFVLYELLGVVTNLVGGWIGAGHGLRRTLLLGLGLQVAALGLMAVHSPGWPQWAAVLWVMVSQGVSGVAKDLTKVSAKTAVKFVAADGALFRLVARLTGSKNALKGVGFFVGAALLSGLGYRNALFAMAAVIGVVLALVLLLLGDLGRAEQKPQLASVFGKSPAISRLSAARFFLFGSRDIWFVVALPVFLDDRFAWSFEAIGAFLACWVIGYGIVQSLAPHLLVGMKGSALGAYGFLPLMAAAVLLVAASVWTDQLPALITVAGLLVFGVMFALTSSVHSYLVLAYSRGDHETALDVGYYYASNAAGRLAGTLLSGLLYALGGFGAALVGTALFLLVAFVISVSLPEPRRPAIRSGADSDRASNAAAPSAPAAG